MLELRQTRRQALLARLYWRGPVRIDHQLCAICSDAADRVRSCEFCEGTGSVPVWEMRPRRFAWLLRPLMGFEPKPG